MNRRFLNAQKAAGIIETVLIALAGVAIITILISNITSQGLEQYNGVILSRIAAALRELPNGFSYTSQVYGSSGKYTDSELAGMQAEYQRLADNLAASIKLSNIDISKLGIQTAAFLFRDEHNKQLLFSICNTGGKCPSDFSPDVSSLIKKLAVNNTTWPRVFGGLQIYWNGESLSNMKEAWSTNKNEQSRGSATRGLF